MTNEERKVIELALEALEYIRNFETDVASQIKYGQAAKALKEALAQPEQDQDEVDIRSRLYQRIHELETQLARGEQEPVAWKLVPTKPTEEMLKAMDECSMEGYDERLYAGHAASVYMAAVDVAPTPPQPKEPEQEPVAWADHGVVNWIADKQFKHASLLYTTPPPCPTCEALARTVMMDQTGRDA